jgi:hypothetical protein
MAAEAGIGVLDDSVRVRPHIPDAALHISDEHSRNTNTERAAECTWAC